MGLLSGAMASVATVCQSVHGGAAAVVITRVGGSAIPTSAIVYRERTEFRRVAGGDRQRTITRKIILPPMTLGVPPDSVFAVDGVMYRVENNSTSQSSGSQTLTGIRNEAATNSRPNYFRR